MSAESQIYVLDSFALLSYLEGEVGKEQVQTILHQAESGECQALASIINLGEVLYITEREQGLPQAQAVIALIDQLPIEILPASREVVFDAAHIKANYPVAYADAFAIAAVQRHRAIVITGDPEFESVKELIHIEWL